MLTLRQEVKQILESIAEENYPIEKVMKDVLTHGCISGMIPQLIYHTEIFAFYLRHYAEIRLYLSNLSYEIYGDSKQILKDFDSIDQLVWIAFEEVTAELYNETLEEAII